MSSHGRSTHRDLLIRTLLGAPCLIVAYWFFRRAGGGNMGMLFVFPCLAAFAAIVCPSLTTSMASFWGAIYMPERGKVLCRRGLQALERPEDRERLRRTHRRLEGKVG